VILLPSDVRFIITTFNTPPIQKLSPLFIPSIDPQPVNPANTLKNHRCS